MLTHTAPQNPARTLSLTPVLFHDLSYLPHPGLARHIVAGAEHDPALAARVIQAAARAPGQRRAAANALAELRAKELSQHLQTKQYASIAELRGTWLPGNNNDSPLLKACASTARFMQAAAGSLAPHIAQQQLEAATRQLQDIDKQLPLSPEPIAKFLPTTLKLWRDILDTTRTAIAEQAKHQLPNPFIVGNPLAPDMAWNRAVFRGRESLISQVESLLADRMNSSSIALLGPRRCGKSSLLNMLRVMLPDTIVILFDLQANPVDTPAAFYQALAAEAHKQADQQHGIHLPEYPANQSAAPASPIEALKRWFDQLENLPGEMRILLAIDEFERLESLFPNQQRELLQLMGLLRATIQHKRRLRILVAGAAPFDELGKIWNDHFINLRELRLGFLSESDVLDLLTAPIEEFPPGTISTELAQEVFRRSQGQPFLSQVYGYALVELLNKTKRQQATLDDLEQIEPELLTSYTYYFRGIWQDIPPAGQAALSALAHGEPVQLEKETRRWLRRRLLINDADQLQVPLFGRWIRDKDEMV